MTFRGKSRGEPKGKSRVGKPKGKYRDKSRGRTGWVTFTRMVWGTYAVKMEVQLCIFHC